MHEQIKLLDHGYLQLIESWGSDERIIESARMSTNKGFQGWGPLPCECARDDTYRQTCTLCKGNGVVPGDEKLLAYLWKNKHHTPFEMAGAIIEVQAPIFVFREWHRHRTQSYNELSARYTPMPDMSYTPTTERCLISGGANKQAGSVGTRELTERDVNMWRARLDDLYVQAQEVYEWGLNLGVPKELARLCIPVGRYSRMRASANLRNWLAFLSLRMDKAAQWEIRQYANALHDALGQLFPRTVALFDGHAV